MKIYDYNIGDLVEISDTQYDFMQAVIKCGGRFDLALVDYPVSQEKIEEWKKDQVFWPVLDGHIKILIRAKGLNPEYIKDFLLSTLAGKKEPTDAQLKAINASIRALGMGLQQRAFTATLTPNNTTVTFNDGLDKPNG
ncbi:MAG: hypothetical protein WC648_05200 [Candidatus Paceibacterota bacterium]|jgi:hypothetical protein